MKKVAINLVPQVPNPSPDYYCTWQTQLYATCDGKPAKQREIIGEKALFSPEKPYGWAYFYEKARKDLFIVLDDSWDVPLNGDPAYYGSLVLNGEKFPQCTEGAASNVEALANLSQRIRQLGWKGVGGWVCAQESEQLVGDQTPEQYWIHRLQEAQEAHFSYWKVDWGKKDRDPEFRRMLTRLGRQYAPDLTIEHAIIREIIPDSAVFRTYDVPAIFSIPMTMFKLMEILSDSAVDGDGLIDCEDEAYIAAAGGFAMGIMRHPYSGSFVDGRADMSFPAIHRNLKTKLYEVLRAVRWHRVAPAFGVSAADVYIDDQQLQDHWRFDCVEEEIENWWFQIMEGQELVHDRRVTKSAPAQITRNCPPAEVLPDVHGDVPYVVAARNPNGAFSIVTLGRTVERSYFLPRCRISVSTGDATLLAVFGEYESLCLATDHKEIRQVLMQDLAGDSAYDVTDQLEIQGGRCTIPGALIHQIGTEAQPKEDTSEPGIMLQLVTQ